MKWANYHSQAKALYGIEVTNDGLVSFSRGVVLKNADGEIVDGIGVSGGMVDQDQRVAEAVANALK